MRPAILLLEFGSIAVGLKAADAMVKRAGVSTLHTGTVQPGKYLVLAGGEVADVEEARIAGREVGATALLAEIYLPEVHPEVVRALVGHRQVGEEDAIGVIETRTAAATIAAADAGVKGARVSLHAVRLADGLGGKGYCIFAGDLPDVEEAVGLGAAQLGRGDELIARVVIPRLHEELRENLRHHPEFHQRLRSYRPEEERSR